MSWFHLSDHGPSLMGLLVISERNARAVVERHAVELERRDAPAHAARVLDDDVIPRGPIPERNGEPLPGWRDTRIEHKSCALQPEAEQPFDPGPVEPSGRSRVPSPAATTDVRRLGVYVSRDDVRLDLVLADPVRRSRMRDGIQHREQFRRLEAVAEGGERNDCPGGRMGILPPVLTHAGQVTLDVPGLEMRVVERGREQKDQPVVPPYQSLVDGSHGAPRTIGL